MSEATGCVVTSITGEPSIRWSTCESQPAPYTTGSRSVQDRREPADCVEVEFLPTRSQTN
jgi:hypothetical protein